MNQEIIKVANLMDACTKKLSEISTMQNLTKVLLDMQKIPADYTAHLDQKYKEFAELSAQVYEQLTLIGVGPAGQNMVPTLLQDVENTWSFMAAGYELNRINFH